METHQHNSFILSNVITTLVTHPNMCITLQYCREENTKGEISGIIRDILLLKSSFSSVGFTWVARDANEVAHVVAALAWRRVLPSNWVLLPPLEPASDLRKEEVVAVQSRNWDRRCDVGGFWLCVAVVCVLFCQLRSILGVGCPRSPCFYLYFSL